MLSRNVRAVLCLLAMRAGGGGALSAQDTLWVAADNPPVWGERLLLGEEVRIGALEGEEYETFGGIAGVVVVGDVVHIADWQGPVIRRFDLEGKYLGQLGRKGEGPGEYLRINGIAALPGDRVVVQDVRRGRGIVYSSGGKHLFEFRLHSGLNSSSPTFQADVNGYTYVLALDREPTAGLVAILDDPAFLWIKHDPEGRVVDSIHVGRANPDGPAYTLVGSEGLRFPFTVDNQSVVSPLGYIIWGRTDRYAFFRELPDGRVVGISRSSERISLTAEETRQWEAYSTYFERGPRAQSYPPIPSVKPFFRSLRADVTGRVWVERYVAPYRHEYPAEVIEARGDRPLMVWRESQVFDVFEPEGRILGTVVLPRNSRLAFALENRVWVIEEGSFGEEYVVQYVIDGAQVGG